MLGSPDLYFSHLSKLNEAVIENLHKLDIEIVSPTFMNQRQVNGLRFISREFRSQKDSKDEKLEILKTTTIQEVKADKENLENL